MHGLDAFFANVQLPSMSEVAHELIQTLNSENPDVFEVSQIISRDPALSARLLRLANSAQFGLPRGVSTLDEAIQMVGLGQVRALALSASLSDAFAPLPGLELQAFWQHSMACAGYAQWLAGALDMDGQQAWLTGMMLRLGELLIGQRAPESLAEIEAQPTPARVRWEREHQLFGFDEVQVTAVLARHWNFPEAIVNGLQSASSPMTADVFDKLSGVVHLAALLADDPSPTPDLVSELPLPVIQALDLDRHWMVARFPRADSFVDVTDL